MYTPTKTRLEPVLITAQQVRSLCRILNKAGRPVEYTTNYIDGEQCPCFIGASPAEIVAAAHYVESLAGLPWLKILAASDPTYQGYFTSHLLRWAA